MGESREFPNPYPDFGGRTGLTECGFETDFRGRLKECESRLFAQFEADLPKIDSSDNSIYTGTCGIALLYRHLSRTCAGEDKERQYYADQSFRYARSALDRRKGRRVTFACGDGGPLALGAVIYHERSEAKKSVKYLNELIGLSSKVLEERQNGDEDDMPDEFLYGRVGYLFALLFVCRQLGWSTVAAAFSSSSSSTAASSSSTSPSLIHDVVDAILRSGRRLSAKEKSASPLMFQWHDRHYLGAAHGVSGICAVLLQAVLVFPEDSTLRRKVSEAVKPTVDFLVSLKFSSGNYPSSLESGDKDKLIHWCHGAPGVIYALVFAHLVFGDGEYLKRAVECGDVIWRRGILRKGYGICHGVSGNAYAFLTLHRLTKDPKYAYRASMFAKWMFDYGKHGCRIADRPLSLFEGMAGTIHFLREMRGNLDESRFPAFDLT